MRTLEKMLLKKENKERIAEYSRKNRKENKVRVRAKKDYVKK